MLLVAPAIAIRVMIVDVCCCWAEFWFGLQVGCLVVLNLDGRVVLVSVVLLSGRQLMGLNTWALIPQGAFNPQYYKSQIGL
jgi:hypothetical protein